VHDSNGDDIVSHPNEKVQQRGLLQVKNGKISRWSDYYDQLTARRFGLASRFTEWIEL
jgi:hypothetical protein